MTGRLRALLNVDSAGCLVLGAAVSVFAERLAGTIDAESVLIVRAVGVVLVVYAILLAGLARMTPSVVAMTGRASAVSDAAWVVVSVELVAAGAFSARGAAIVTALAVGVAAMGASKLLALRSVPGGTNRSRLARAA